MCISTDSRNIVTIRTVNIDSANDQFKPEVIQVCTSCDCMRLPDYGELVERRIKDKTKTVTGW